MAVGINTRRWNRIPSDKNVWNWNAKRDNTHKTRVNITWDSVLDTLFYNTSTTSAQGIDSVCYYFFFFLYIRTGRQPTVCTIIDFVVFRVDKHWFVVRDGSVKTERLLTLVPKNPKSVLECSPDTRRTILDLFLTLQHPYIYPVLDVEFVEGATDPETTFITLVLPFNSKGSLKDLIYKVNL